MTPQLDPGISRKLGQFVSFCSLFSIAVGLTGLAGWIFQIEILKAVFPGLVAMKANTAACFVLIGVSLGWLGAHDRGCSPVSSGIAKAAATMVSAVGLLSFLEFLGGWNFGIDQRLFAETVEEAIGSIRPGLMSPITALAFVLLGLALLLLDWTRNREVLPAQTLAFGSGLISLFALLDFMIQPHAFHTHMALPTVIALCLLSLGVVCSRPERGFVGTLLRADFRAGIMRGLWAAALAEDGPAWRRPLPYGLAALIVFLATLLRFIPGGFLPERLPYITFYPATMIAALLGGLGPGILATLLSDICIDYFFLVPKGQFGNKSLPDLTGLIIFTLVGIGMSWLAGAAEQTRKGTAAALRASENRYRTLAENLPQMVFVKDRASVYVSCNQSFARSLGIRPEEYAGKTDYDFFSAELAEKYRRDDQRVMESGTTEEIEEKYIRDGKELSVQTVKTPIRDAAGNVTGILGIFWDITERKRVEAEAREAQERFRLLLDGVKDYAIYMLDPEGNVISWNEGATRVKGYRSEEILGKHFSCFYKAEDIEAGKPARELRESVSKGRFEEEHWRVRKDGSAFWANVVITPMYDDSGTLRGFSKVARDITERKRAEEQLRRSSLYARSLIEASLDPLVTISREGKITDVNEATEKVTGASREKLIGSDFSDYFTDPESARRAYEHVFAQGAVQDYPLAIRSAVGKVTDVLYNASVFRNESGEVEGVFAAARDITERKRAEAELQESETKFRMLAELAPQLVWMCTPDGLNVYFNQRWVEYTGQTLEESYGRGWNTPFHADDKQAAWAAWNHAVATGETYRIESRLRAADGSYRWFLMRGVPLRDASGSIVKWFGTCTDIDDLKRAEAELSRLNAELDERVRRRTAELDAANKELEAFTYSVSHDLRAPLRHISGFSKILTEEYSSSLAPDAQHHLQRIQEGTRRMGLLVDDLLNLGRVGRHELRLQVTGLNSVVNEAVAELKAECEGRQVEWKIGSLPFVECDPGLMKQVFQNLLSNAVKFTRPRPRAVVEVGQKEEHGNSVVFVRDNGVGFSMKYADKLFGVFQRLHRPEDFEGTGVGLATVQRIVKKHGGRIWAEAELDKGATFFFTLGTSEKIQLKTKAAIVGDPA
jgi:PAS domain S-box-containing protein